MAISGHILWVCGWLVPLSISAPFVRAEDLKQVEAQQTAMEKRLSAIQEAQMADRLDSLDTKIFELRRAQCKETVPAIKDQYAQRVNELAKRYFDATKQWPRIAPCDQT